MKTGLFFGSFNPIHNGHVALADYFAHHGLDEVWLVVSPRNPLKAASDLWDDRTRLRLAEMALRGKPRLRVCDIEFSLPKPSYTIDTLRVLRSRLPERRFVLIIGADNAAVFDRWKECAAIVSEFEVWAYPRAGFPSRNAAFPQIRFVDAPLYDLSATEVRHRLAQGQSIRGLVPDAVAAAIESHVAGHRQNKKR